MKWLLKLITEKPNVMDMLLLIVKKSVILFVELKLVTLSILKLENSSLNSILTMITKSI